MIWYGTSGITCWIRFWIKQSVQELEAAQEGGPEAAAQVAEEVASANGMPLGRQIQSEAPNNFVLFNYCLIVKQLIQQLNTWKLKIVKLMFGLRFAVCSWKCKFDAPGPWCLGWTCFCVPGFVKQRLLPEPITRADAGCLGVSDISTFKTKLGKHALGPTKLAVLFFFCVCVCQTLPNYLQLIVPAWFACHHHNHSRAISSDDIVTSSLSCFYLFIQLSLERLERGSTLYSSVRTVPLQVQDDFQVEVIKVSNHVIGTRWY